MSSTIDLSKQNTLFEVDVADMVEQISARLLTDDFHIESLDNELTYLYIETIVNRTQLFEELAPKINLLTKNPENWPETLSRGNKQFIVEKALVDLMDGNIIILHKAWRGYIVSIPLADFKERAIEQTEMEKVLFGAKDSYNEDLETNISLLRRHNKDVNLTVEYYTVGERSKNKVALVYYRDIANPKFVKDISKKLEEIHIDRVLGQKDLMELVIGKNQTVFPLYELVENPSRSTHFLNDGRILLLIDGTPFAAMLPMILLNMFFAAEYFTQGNIIAVAVRLIRFVASLLALYIPAFYVAIVGINTAILPTELGLLIAQDRALIPYPIVVEMIVLLVVLDMFLEATSYVPGNIGSALNIVGSLVIGQAAAEVNLVSEMSIIIAAVTAIGTYVTLHQLSYALRMWKYVMVLAAALLGFYGMVCASAVMVTHLCSLKSLGVPYMSPLAPLNFGDIFKDFFPYQDISKRVKRKQFLQPIDKDRQTDDKNS